MNITLLNLATTHQSLADNTQAAIAWNTAVEDSMAGFNVGSPTRITIPAGVSKVRLSASAMFQPNATGLRRAWINKNGAAFVGMGHHSDQAMLDAAASQILPVISAVVDVVPGDYFELFAQQRSGAALNFVAGVQSWFQCEVVA